MTSIVPISLNSIEIQWRCKSHINHLQAYYAALQSEKAVTTYLLSNKLLHFGFAQQQYYQR